MASAKSENIIDMEFTRLRSHTDPNKLREEIQGIIDETSGQYDAILLGYGLCGNGTAGLKARSVQMVIPRAHDCCTIFLGSRAAFLEHFGRTPSAQWYNACYYERLGGWYADLSAGTSVPGQNNAYEELAEKYGEENAQYIWETMYSGKNDIDFLTYIDLPDFDDRIIRDDFVRYAGEKSRKTRFIKGSNRLIEALVKGGWADEEFLVIPPGAEIRPIYDHDRIMGT